MTDDAYRESIARLSHGQINYWRDRYAVAERQIKHLTDLLTEATAKTARAEDELDRMRTKARMRGEHDPDAPPVSKDATTITLEQIENLRAAWNKGAAIENPRRNTPSADEVKRWSE